MTPSTPVERTRHQLASENITDLRHFDAQLRTSRRRVEEAAVVSGTALMDIFGVGPIVAAMIIGHTRTVGGRVMTDRQAFM